MSQVKEKRDACISAALAAFSQTLRVHKESCETSSMPVIALLVLAGMQFGSGRRCSHHAFVGTPVAV
jgi:hypothetical protein